MKQRPRILFLIGPVAPCHSTNANLMLKFISALSADAQIHVVSIGSYAEHQTDLQVFPELPIRLYKYSTRTHTLYTPEGEYRPTALQTLAAKWISRFIDRGGFSDAFDGMLLKHCIEALDRQYRYRAVVSCMEPYQGAYAAASASVTGKKLLYVIDPPADVVPGLSGGRTPFRDRTSPRILASADLLITTPRILSALEKASYDLSGKPVVAEEFPLYAPLRHTPGGSTISFDPGRINLLYCGWLRNEAFLLDVLKGLDDRFCVTFIGNDSKSLSAAETGAQLRTFPAVSHPEAVNAILEADALLCIGNAYPVHIPSKVFEYVASGKPIVNFHILPDCPTLTYTGSYPLALNLPVSMATEEAARKVAAFCAAARGNSVPPDTLSELYHHIDSEQIIRRICDRIRNEVEI